MEKKVELLAPAGSLETCKAVIHAGADAVYLGGSRFGARAYAKNLTQEELLEAIDYAHLFGRKIHLTVNTLLKQPEMEQLYDYLLPYFERGLDAVIVQDYGVLRFLGRSFPGLALHISTQVSVAGSDGASYLWERGADRIVLARELSLAEIKKIHSQVPVELECFVHGALCYCYSGQCLLSSMLGGRSGNRGRCAQPCRLAYSVLDQEKNVVRKDCYPLSPKDLCAISLLSELIQAGVSSFKIEGRMKTAEYATGVVSVYRRYLDACLQGKDTAVAAKDEQRLLDSGNRSGFTHGYYQQRNGKDMIAFTRSAHAKNKEAAARVRREQVLIDPKKIPIRGRACFRIGQPAKLELFAQEAGVSCQVTGEVVQEAKKRPMEEEELRAQLEKLGNTPFVMERLELESDASIFLPKQQVNQLRREGMKQLEGLLMKPYRRSPVGSPEPFSHESDARAVSGNGKEQLFFSALVQTSQQLLAAQEAEVLSRVYLDWSMYHKHPKKEDTERLFLKLEADVKALHQAGKEAYYGLPAVFREDAGSYYEAHWEELLTTGLDGFLAKSQDELGFLKRHGMQGRCVLDYTVPAWSNTTKRCYEADGWYLDTVPVELNKKELLHRDNSGSEWILYGYLPLMISAQCIHANTGTCDKTLSLCCLKDRYGKEFAVQNHCGFCYNVLYNSQPLSLLQLASQLPHFHTGSYRLQFTLEDARTTRQVLGYCREAFLEGASRIPDFLQEGYTYGHYKRGVE